MTVEDAQAHAKSMAKPSDGDSTPKSPLLAGERNCLRVDGFDLGNSPLEYVSVQDADIVFTTTNGTAAMGHCLTAKRVVIGAFTNLTAVRTFIANQSHVQIVCSGTNGAITREDVLFAGALADGFDGEQNDSARIAAAAWREVCGKPPIEQVQGLCDWLAKAFENTLGGGNLLAVGSSDDLIAAAEVDRWDFVPEFVRAEPFGFIAKMAGATGPK